MLGRFDQFLPKLGVDAFPSFTRIEAGYQQGAQATDELAEELGEFPAGIGLPLDDGQCCRCIPLEEGQTEGAQGFT